MEISHVRLHVIGDRNSDESFDMTNNILISNDYCGLHSIRYCGLCTADCALWTAGTVELKGI
jgi:hypothetical protein